MILWFVWLSDRGTRLVLGGCTCASSGLETDPRPCSKAGVLLAAVDIVARPAAARAIAPSLSDGKLHIFVDGL